MSADNTYIDVVIPIYNEQKNIVSLVEHTTTVLLRFFTKITFILVDDGSTDNTRYEIEQLNNMPSSVYVKYICLARNYGKDLALKCGIDHSTSPICAMMDGDFQHPPEKIVEAYQKIVEGYNIVHILKQEYNHIPWYRQIGSNLFKWVVNFLSGSQINLTDFKVLDSNAISALKQFKEKSFFSAGIIDMIGLASTAIYYYPQKRKHGMSKFSFLRLFALAFASIIAISVKPLRISIYFGFAISFVSFLYGFFIICEKIFLGQPIPGFPTLAAAIFFLGGLQLLFLGVIGEYLGKTFLESKRRPQYTIQHIVDFGK